MGVTIQASDLIEDIRLRAELPAFTTTTSVRTADVLYWLRRSLQRLSAIVGNASGAHFVQQSDLTTTAGVDVVSLPANAQAVVSVYYVRDGETQIPMDRMGPDELVDLAQRGWSADIPRYALKGETLQLRPVPDSAYTVRVEYVTGMIITASSDYVPMYFGWDEWVVLDVVCKIKQRLQQPYAEFMQEREKIEVEIRRHARRDRYRGSLMRDVRPHGLSTLRQRNQRRWPGEP